MTPLSLGHRIRTPDGPGVVVDLTHAAGGTYGIRQAGDSEKCPPIWYPVEMIEVDD